MISGEPRRTVEACLRLDVRAPRVRGALSQAGVGQWEWPLPEGKWAVVPYAVRGYVLALLLPSGDQRGQTIRIERTACRFGGARRWWRCPRCGRRCAVLFMAPGGGEGFACRTCGRLTYRSRLLGQAERLDLRRDRLVARWFGRAVAPGRFPPKPRTMRWATYVRLRAQVEQLEERALLASARRLGFR
jgi:hypothetical protein